MRTRKWTLDEQAGFLRRTGELLLRGYPLSEAIESLAYHLPDYRKAAISESLRDLKEGYPFFRILANLRFNPTLIGYVYFAEQHGGLAEAFIDGSAIMARRSRDISSLRKILYYPLFLMAATSILFFFVQHTLLPRFTSLFSSMDLKANFFTEAVMLAGAAFPILAVLAFALGAGLCSYYFLKFKHLPQIDQKRRLAMLPAAGPLLRLFYTHYFTAQLGYLLGGGLSVSEALLLFQRNTQQPFYSEIGEAIKIRLRTGEKLDDILSGFAFFQEDLCQIIRHGERNGKLGQELKFYSIHCMEAFEHKIRACLQIIQPVLFSLIGALVISMYLAVMLPMFHLLNGL
jgi:competence protein ComGB